MTCFFYLYPEQEAISPSGTYFLFAGFAALAVLYVFALVPETKGKSPEEAGRPQTSDGNRMTEWNW